MKWYFLKYKIRQITLYFIKLIVNVLFKEQAYQYTSIYECTIQSPVN